jgi:hypothetical protein
MVVIHDVRNLVANDYEIEWALEVARGNFVVVEAGAVPLGVPDHPRDGFCQVSDMWELVQRLKIESGLGSFFDMEDLPLKAEYGRTLCQDDTQDRDETCNQRVFDNQSVFDQTHEDLEGSDFYSEGAVNPSYGQIPYLSPIECKLSIYITDF